MHMFDSIYLHMFGTSVCMLIHLKESLGAPLLLASRHVQHDKPHKHTTVAITGCQPLQGDKSNL